MEKTKVSGVGLPYLDVRNPSKDISFPIFTREEVETKKNGKEIKTIISSLNDLSSFLSNI